MSTRDLSGFRAGTPPLPVIGTYSRDASPSSFLNCAQLNGNSIASAAWPTANKAIFIPFTVGKQITVALLYCNNGATASGNLDMGIYDTAGNRLVSKGSTAQSGTSVWQALDITDTVLGPGQYYLALAMDGTTGTASMTGTLSNNVIKEAGVVEMASAFPLPATATFAASAITKIPDFAAGILTVF